MHFFTWIADPQEQRERISKNPQIELSGYGFSESNYAEALASALRMEHEEGALLGIYVSYQYDLGAGDGGSDRFALPEFLMYWPEEATTFEKFKEALDEPAAIYKPNSPSTYKDDHIRHEGVDMSAAPFKTMASRLKFLADRLQTYPGNFQLYGNTILIHHDVEKFTIPKYSTMKYDHYRYKHRFIFKDVEKDAFLARAQEEFGPGKEFKEYLDDYRGHRFIKDVWKYLRSNPDLLYDPPLNDRSELILHAGGMITLTEDRLEIRPEFVRPNYYYPPVRYDIDYKEPF